MLREIGDWWAISSFDSILLQCTSPASYSGVPLIEVEQQVRRIELGDGQQQKVLLTQIRDYLLDFCSDIKSNIA